MRLGLKPCTSSWFYGEIISEDCRHKGLCKSSQIVLLIALRVSGVLLLSVTRPRKDSALYLFGALILSTCQTCSVYTSAAQRVSVGLLRCDSELKVGLVWLVIYLPVQERCSVYSLDFKRVMDLYEAEKALSDTGWLLPKKNGCLFCAVCVYLFKFKSC